MQPRGALAETPLTSLLESAQGEKSTGTLILRNGPGHSMSLYFVFGQLVHAVGDGVTGDDAVVKTVRRDEPKVGRNDPCPCGSGKKYKKCHGAAA